ncbi:hypothetical protein JCM16303_002399 [Sporobolomyces ruberrimus]
MFSQHPLHNPAIVLPPGPRTPSQVSHSINPLTSNRAAHITRLYSILQHLLSLPPCLANSTRLLRAWRALAKCKEVHLGVLWRVGTAVLEHNRTSNSNDDDEEASEARSQRKADWLKSVQEGKFEKVVKFNEYILSLCALGGTESMRFALEELESYLDNQPYHDSITLNLLSAQLSLFLAQPGPTPLHYRPPPPTDSSDSSGDEHGDREQGGRGENGKRIKPSQPVSPDEELLKFLQALSKSSPSLFSKAKERLKRARQLTERQVSETLAEGVSRAAVEGVGEASRWLNLIARAEKIDNRDGSPF